MDYSIGLLEKEKIFFGYNFSEIYADYQEFVENESKKEKENTELVLCEIEKLVSGEYLKAINAFLSDDENGIWGGLKIVEEPIGEWQDEYQDNDEANYWNVLKGMFVNQSCGYSGDDYHGTLEVKITDKLLLRCSFSL